MTDFNMQVSRPPIKNVFDAASNFMVPASVEEQTVMMENIKEIFALEKEMARDDVDMDGEEDEILDTEDQLRKTERLRGVLEMLAKLWWADSEYMNLVTEKLADMSRDPKWRIPLGDSGILNFFLQILSNTQTLRHSMKIHILRILGNSCADTDENRARVITSNYLPSIMTQLGDTSLLPFVIPVLYNICIDYEPAQQQASDSMLTQGLVELISSSRFSDSIAFLGYICKLLDLMIAKSSEPDVAPDNTAVVLLRIAADRESPTDMEDFVAIVNTAVAYLQHEKFQRALIIQGALDTTLAVLVDSYTRFDSHPSIGTSSPDQDDAKMLSQMRSNLNQVLSDVSALPEFKKAVPVISPFSASLRRWLSSPQLQLQVCACIMLGNLARSDAACEEFVHKCQVHIPLITALTNANDSQLLHAALGFLKNLALPQNNKLVLGNAGLLDVLPRLWALDTLQQIQFSSISLARNLMNATFDNVRNMCRRLSQDHDSPASNRTKVSLLIALFERTDVEPIKMEISRLVTAVCRVYNTVKDFPEAELQSMRARFFTRHPDIGRPLGFMVSQKKWPVVRSEGWFVFALMARYPEGAACISDVMHDVNVFQPLVELLTGQNLVDYKSSGSAPTSAAPTSAAPTSATSPSYFASSQGSNSITTPGITPDSQNPPGTSHPHPQASEMARIDRENALVLVSELLKNRGEQMAVMRRMLFADLLKGGGELVMSYKQASPGWRGENLVLPERKISAGLGLQEVVEQSLVELG